MGELGGSSKGGVRAEIIDGKVVTYPVNFPREEKGLVKEEYYLAVMERDILETFANAIEAGNRHGNMESFAGRAIRADGGDYTVEDANSFVLGVKEKVDSGYVFETDPINEEEDEKPELSDSEYLEQLTKRINEALGTTSEEIREKRVNGLLNDIKKGEILTPHGTIDIEKDSHRTLLANRIGERLALKEKE